MAEEYNSIERTTRTLAFQPVDRVPVDLHNFMVTPRFMNVKDFSGFFRDGAAMAEGQVKAWKRYGHDVLLIEPPQLLRIEGGGGLVHVGDIEELDHLVECEYLLVAV